MKKSGKINGGRKQDTGRGYKGIFSQPHPQPPLLIPAKAGIRKRGPGGEVITIITPSLNQADFIERTIHSVLSQKGDFDLEYIVIDGGSTDGTVHLLEQYGDKIKWISERDNGQSDAVRKGIAMSSGEIIGWLNSDDVYLPGTLQKMADYFTMYPACQWLYGRCRIIDDDDHEIRRWITYYKNFMMRRFSYNKLLIENFISQPAVFVKRSLIEKEGFTDPSLNYVMDYDLWLRLARTIPPGIVNDYLACFRVHDQSKSRTHYRSQFREEYLTHKKYHQRKILLFLHRLNILKITGIYSIMNVLDRFRHFFNPLISSHHE